MISSYLCKNLLSTSTSHLNLENNAKNGFYAPNYPTDKLFLSLHDNWLISENFEHCFLSEYIYRPPNPKEMDSTHPITTYKNLSALFYNILFNCNNFRHYRQIPTGVAQLGCHHGNQTGFVLGPHRSMNVQKTDISRFMH